MNKDKCIRLIDEIHIPNEISNNPLYIGCRTYWYELFFIRLVSFIGYGSGVRLSPKSINALTIVIRPRIEIADPIIIK